MKLSQIFSWTAITLPLLQVSCSSHDTKSSRTPPPIGTEEGPNSGPSPALKDGSGSPTGSGSLWASDVSDEKVQPCPKEKIFANGKCFDEVHFSDASIELTRPNETFTLFEAGKPLNPFILQNYKFSEDEGSAFVLINERLAAMDPMVAFSNRYWFLPAKIRVSKTENKKDLSAATFMGAQFPLSFTYGSEKTSPTGLPESWFFKGSIFLCGKTLALPIRQEVVESECKTTLQSNDNVSFANQFGEGSLDLEYLETTIAARRAYWISIGKSQYLR